jgi:thiopurine S-methyltransferase
MDIDFWAKRWQEGRIGFHEGRPNEFLVRHASRLDGARRILVPLCGKTEDLAFLAARGHEVVGIEAVELAARAFFAEHGLADAVQVHGRAWTAGRVTILVADVLSCTPADVGPCDGLFDRAALYALPPETRARYVRHLRSLLASGARGLLLGFEYPENAIEGPPFSVRETEVRQLWDGATVDLIESGTAEVARLREVGLQATERCFAIAI